ncbi:MAG: hypothetical protein Rhob2KO_49290 [Rhodopirellula baltica]
MKCGASEVSSTIWAYFRFEENSQESDVTGAGGKMNQAIPLFSGCLVRIGSQAQESPSEIGTPLSQSNFQQAPTIEVAGTHGRASSHGFVEFRCASAFDRMD